MDSVIAQQHTHIWVHSVKWKSGTYGKCMKGGLHVHDMGDQIIIFCFECKEPYKKKRPHKVYDNVMDRAIDKYNNPEKLYKIYGYPDGRKI